MINFFSDNKTYSTPFPDELSFSLIFNSYAVTARFNYIGTLLAVGYSNGLVIIWDFLNRKIAQKISYHVYSISALAWNDDKKIAICSYDGQITVWDAISCSLIVCYSFTSSPIKCTFRNNNDSLLLVSLFSEPSVIIDCNTNSFTCLDSFFDSSMACYSKKHSTITCFNHNGSYIIEGSQNGCIRILSSDNLSCLASFQSCHNQVEVISIEASRNSDIFLVNCSDRVIRIFDLKSAFDSKFVQPLVEMQDQVNKVSWASAIFSCGSEYVITCSHKHDMLFIWDIMSGTLIKTLSLHVGEKFVDLAYHPYRDLLVCISGGIVAVWSRTENQLWSCLDPNFKHISQNEIYKEKEDEFDLDRVELSIKPDENPDLKLDQDINLFEKVELMDTNHHDYIIKS